MSWLLALGLGAGVGLVYFGGLWLTVRRVACHPRQRALLPLSLATRLAIVALALYGLSRGGASDLLAGLAGLWLVRWNLVGVLGRERHGH